MWDAGTGDLIRSYEGHVGGGFLSSGVNTVAFSPDGSQILSGGQDGKAKLWDASSGSL